MIRKKLFCRIGRLLILFFGVVIVWFLFGNQLVWADGESIHFGSESYEWEVGEENPIGIYTVANTDIDSFIYKVTYDPGILEYVSGGVVLSDHEIEVRVNNVDDSYYVLYLYFKPITSDATSIKVSDIHITDIEGNVLTTPEVSVGINGSLEGDGMLESIMVNGISIPGFQSDKLEYSIYVKPDVTSAEIQTIPADVHVDVSDTVLKEGKNEIELICTDGDGNQTVYKLNVYRPETQVTENKAQEQDEKTQSLISSLSEMKISGSFLVVICVLAVLIILFVILCIVRIHIIREQKRKAERRRQHLKEKESLKRQYRENRDQQLVNQQRQQKMDKENSAFESTENIVEPYKPEETKGKDEQEKNDSELEIRVSHITMDFKREKDESSSIKEVVIRTLKRQRTFESFRALDDVSFDVKKGEVVGIIGTNGSGKSTILKIISGALIPTKGKVKVDRRKIQLLTLGTGFDMELTGRENIYLNGAIIGYTKEYIDEKFDDIVKFAELEGFMDERVKNYSSGMVSRLGFAIATCRETPEILILDEVLSVGDMFFRKKSEERIQEMIHGGSTVLIVSHSTSVIRKNCTKVVWIERGKLRAVGTPEDVCNAYEKMNK